MSEADKRIELIDYCIKNNYEYRETSTEINISKIVDELENVSKSLTYYKKEKELGFWEDKDDLEQERLFTEDELNIIMLINDLRLKEVQ